MPVGRSKRPNVTIKPNDVDSPYWRKLFGWFMRYEDAGDQRSRAKRFDVTQKKMGDFEYGRGGIPVEKMPNILADAGMQSPPIEEATIQYGEHVARGVTLDEALDLVDQTQGLTAQQVGNMLINKPSGYRKNAPQRHWFWRHRWQKDNG